MALAIVQAFARTPYRVRAVFSGGDPTSQIASSFTITRQDGGPTAATVVRVIAVDANSIDLAMGEPLIKTLIYVLTWLATPTPFSFQPPIAQRPDVQPTNEDPEAEILGVSLAWIGGDPTASGDCPRVSGRACLAYDLNNVAILVPGELVQAPDAGAALDASVNNSLSDAELQSTAARLERELRRDRRVKDVAIDVNSTADGEVDFAGSVVDIATGLATPVGSAS